MMNISEFERNKPVQTYKKIHDLIEKYQSYVDDIKEVMDLEDAAYKHAYLDILKELEDLRKIFLEGK